MIEIIRPRSRPTEVFRSRARCSGRRTAHTLVALVAFLAADAARCETFRLVPSVSLTETYSDNIALVPDAQARSGWVTGLGPAIQAELSGARVKGSLDFRLQHNTYSSESRLNRTERFLNSSGKVEAIEQLLFVDARASISQQNRTPFGVALNPDASSQSSNRVETTVYQLSPHVRGNYSDVASYQLRFIETYSRVDDVTPPETRASEWVAKIGNATRSAKLGWSIDANASRLRSDAVGTLQNSRIRGSLIYAVDPQLHLIASEGHETTDFLGPPRRDKDTPGVGLDWSPSVRTQLSAVYERRFFGDGHNVLLSHRTPSMAFKLTSIKDATTLPTQLVANSLNSVASLLSELLTSAIPDPEARTEAVKRRLEEYGVSGSSAISSNVVTSRPFVNRSSVASLTLLGATNTVTLTASRREQRPFSVGVEGADALAEDPFRQTGFDATFAHRLSPFTSLTLSATRLRTEALTLLARQTRQTSYILSVTSKLGSRTSASLGVLHLNFSSSQELESYRENTIFAGVSVKM